MRLIKVEGQDAFPDFEFCYDGLLDHLLRAAGDKDLTVGMMRAQAWRESCFNPIARSLTGAQGLFQFTGPAWADMDDDPSIREKEEDIFLNAQRAVKLMSAHTVRYRSGGIVPPERWKFSLAAFNQGAGNVRKARELCRAAEKDPAIWLNVHPFFDRVLPDHRALEVKAYVRTVVARLEEYRAMGAA